MKGRGAHGEVAQLLEKVLESAPCSLPGSDQAGLGAGERPRFQERAAGRAGGGPAGALCLGCLQMRRLPE